MRTTHAMTIIHTSKKAFQYLSMICRLINVPEVLWFLRTNVSTLVLVTLKGMPCQCCVVYFVYNACLVRILIRHETWAIICERQNLLFSQAISIVTNNKNILSKTFRLTGFHWKMQSVSIFLQVRSSVLPLVFAMLVTSSFNFLSGCFNVSLNLVAVPSEFR